MNGIHPREMELAHLGDGETGWETEEHLRWCARCCNVAADYRWLRGEIAATLVAVAEIVPVPRSSWRAVQERVFAGQQRVVERRASAFVSFALAVLIMLSVPGYLAPARAAQGSQPGPVMVPAPVTAAVSDETILVAATPTPGASGGEAGLSPTPGVLLPPTPPDTDISRGDLQGGFRSC
jgi:hypothetical protein